ncbi:hypothetical protein PP740_gp047 [Stenotrophomonas phage Philippe]|uniref:Uncharacterized protein n=1 Tax=Stenotrophomonas phage Philippe TaxID=2859655 RepID=A0AAE8BJL7_9CAUD|nr:hypothetical protein PP740_gp047 [Stenotrophomonas phage Philippe]QYW02246.1 hypothetical protein CPT_Philippe_047 [Stenotrophomonas phage Philippe]
MAPRKKTATKKVAKKTAAKKAPVKKRSYTRKVKVDQTPPEAAENVNVANGEAGLTGGPNPVFEALRERYERDQQNLTHFNMADFIIFGEAPSAVRLQFVLWLDAAGYKLINMGRPASLLEKAWLTNFLNEVIVGVHVDQDHKLIELVAEANQELLDSHAVVTLEALTFQLAPEFGHPTSHVKSVISQNGAVYQRIG